MIVDREHFATGELREIRKREDRPCEDGNEGKYHVMGARRRKTTGSGCIPHGRHSAFAVHKFQVLHLRPTMRQRYFKRQIPNGPVLARTVLWRTRHLLPIGKVHERIERELTVRSDANHHSISDSPRRAGSIQLGWMSMISSGATGSATRTLESAPMQLGAQPQILSEMLISTDRNEVAEQVVIVGTWLRHRRCGLGAGTWMQLPMLRKVDRVEWRARHMIMLSDAYLNLFSRS
ncbi:hypothetical protein POSPLADRAFT_1031118 [Postia placenta MAD-698-R-SB12]|uniref:Uncharacterized protein n=1 Tax=Postia placenta MAD-698-R-SB12 TaxID=670580 RepID=A0A1X6NBQ6_9APHY|nr:hypothetical protein POSPLADRAFT_1031118 [Postia placenta MAD-698-R-SB12]OSX65876.1 hypothetical protein POSPLADRAFT_1031118 [Postia placenta MAD-698-R-SB12]